MPTTVKEATFYCWEIWNSECLDDALIPDPVRKTGLNFDLCPKLGSFTGSLKYLVRATLGLRRFSFFFFFFFWFLGLYLWHIAVLSIGVESELQLKPYATATATSDLSYICKLHHSSWQHRILNPLSKTRDRTHIPMNTGQVRYHWATVGTPWRWFFIREMWLRMFGVYYWFELLFLWQNINSLVFASVLILASDRGLPNPLPGV